MILHTSLIKSSYRISAKSLFTYTNKPEPIKSTYRRQLSNNVIPLNSAQGKKLFQQSLRQKYCESFFTLIQHFNCQNEVSTCASATLAMILNALKIDPGKNWKGIWRWYDDYNIKEMNQSKLHEGLTLQQFHDLAIKNGAKSMTFSPKIDQQSKNNDILKNSSLNLFRNCVISCHRRTNMLISINFSRKSLSQTGSGHFSPLAAYNLKKDMVLVLDVAKFKYDSYWCSVEEIYESFKDKDLKSNKSRGFSINKKQYQIQQQPISSLCSLEIDTQVNNQLHKLLRNNQVKDSTKEKIQFIIGFINNLENHKFIISILYEFHTTPINKRQQILSIIAKKCLNIQYLQDEILENQLNQESKLLIQAFSYQKTLDTLLFLYFVLLINTKDIGRQLFVQQKDINYVKMIRLILKCQRSLQISFESF